MRHTLPHCHSPPIPSRVGTLCPSVPLPTQVLEILDDTTVRRLSEVQQENLAPVQQAPEKPQGTQAGAAQAAAAAAVAVASLQAADAARPAAVLHNR